VSRLAVAAAIATALSGAAAAQPLPVPAGGGMITGEVRDQETGEMLAGVTVVIASPALDGTRAEISDDGGRYRFDRLPAGRYQVTFYYAESVEVRDDVIVVDDAIAWVPTTLYTGYTCVLPLWFDDVPMVDATSAGVSRVLAGDDLFHLPVRGRRRAPAARVWGLAWPEGAPAPPDAMVDEIEVTAAGGTAARGGIAPAADLALRSGSNQHHLALVARRGAGAADSQARAAGPVVADRVWYAVAVARQQPADSITALAQLNWAVTPEHQGGVMAYTDRWRPGGRAAAVAGSPGPLRAGRAVDPGVARVAMVAADWRSRFDDNRFDVEAAAGWSRLADAGGADDRASGRVALTRRLRALGHHLAIAGVDAGHTRAGRSGDAGVADAALWIGDSWQPLPDLTVDAGLRGERETVDRGPATGDHHGLVPRAGLAWDWTREGRSRAFVGLARPRAPATASAPPRQVSEVVGGAELELERFEGLALLAAWRHAGDGDGPLLGARVRRRHLEGQALWQLRGPAGAPAQRIEVDAIWRFDLCVARDLLVGAHVDLGRRWTDVEGEAGGEAGVQVGKRIEATRELAFDVAVDLVASPGVREALVGVRVGM